MAMVLAVSAILLPVFPSTRLYWDVPHGGGGGVMGADSPVASQRLVRRSQAGLLPWLYTLASGLAGPVALQVASFCPTYSAIGALDLPLWMLAAGAGAQQPPSLPSPIPPLSGSHLLLLFL